MNSAHLYWPDTHHPSLDQAADFIRRHLIDQSMRPVRILKPGEGDSAVTDVETLTVREALGVAPYVGRPFVYIWRVAIAEDGRWVAGSAHIQHLPPDPSNPASWV